MASIGDLVANLKLESGGFKGELNKATAELKHFAVEAAGLAGIGFGLESVIESVKGQIEAVTELSHTATKTGIDINDLQALKMEAKQTGVEFEVVTASIKKMGINIAQAASGGEKSGAFKKLELDAAKLAQEKPADQIREIFDAMGGLENQTDKVSAAFEIFGKQGPEMLELISRGAGGVDEALGKIQANGKFLDPSQVEAMEQAHLGMQKLEGSINGLERAFAIQLAPSIADATQKLAAFITESNKSGGSPLMDMIGKSANFTIGAAAGAAYSMMGIGASARIMYEQMEHGQKASEGAALVAENIWDRAGASFRNSVGIVDEAAQKMESDVAKSSEEAAASLAVLQKEMAETNAYYQKMGAEANRLEDSLATPLEKANEEFQKIQDMFAAGFISDDTMLRGLEQWQEKLEEIREKDLKPLRDEFNRMASEAQGVWDQTRTPMEKYDQQIKKLSDMLQTGALDEDTFARAAGKAQDDLSNETAAKFKRGPQGSHASLGVSEAGSRETLQAMADRINQRTDGPDAQTAQNTAALLETQKQAEDHLAKLLAKSDDAVVFNLLNGGGV